MKGLLLLASSLFIYVAYLGAQTTVFSDNFESGTSNWTLTGTWGTTTAGYHSATHSLTESPTGNYGDNITILATMTNGVNLSNALSANLSFWAKYNIEGGFDYMYLEVSPNGGTSWNTIATYDDTSLFWHQYTYSLGGYCGNTNVKVRFRFFSDGAVNFDGMLIDDLVITSDTTDNAAPLILHTAPEYYLGTEYQDTVSASIIDISGIKKAYLFYAIDNGAFDSTVANSVSGSTYKFIIPQKTAGSMVKYFFYAQDSSNAQNSATTSIYKKIAGKHIYYDAGVVDFVDSIGVSSGASMRMTLPTATRVSTVLIRNYTDVNRPNDSILVHIWSSSGGLPGTDLVTPKKVFPAATLSNTSAVTVVDFRSDSTALSGLTGDIFIGYTVPSGGAWATITQPSSIMRSYKYSSTGWAAASGTSGNSDFHFRVVTTGAGPLPVSDFTIDAASSPTINFTSNAQYATTYEWNFGDASPVATTQNASHSYTHNGNFNVCLKVTNTAGFHTTCKQVSIASFTAPVALYSYDTTNTPTLAFTDLSTNNPTSWYWNFGDGGLTSGQMNPTHVFPSTQTGTYNVCLTASSINGSSTPYCELITIHIGIGMDEAPENQVIKIFPNPVTNHATIDFKGKTANVVFELFDLEGKSIAADYKVGADGISFTRGTLEAGVYIFRITDGDKKQFTGSLIIK